VFAFFNVYYYLTIRLTVILRCVAVKYLREVTPYFRKASIISEVGWELQRGFLSGAPPAVRSPQRADTRYLPLQLCHLARSFKYPDPGKVYQLDN
jgi:beta-syntrophin